MARQIYYLHGHGYYKRGRYFYYEDDNKRVYFDNPRPCKECGMEIPASGHDPCIANLPGVRYACCGHGKERGYVAFKDGRVIRGHFDKAS